MEVDRADQLETRAAATALDLAHPPAKRRRTAENEWTGQEDTTQQTEWHFDYGRHVSSDGTKRIHLKDPKGASYTRNGKETSWRCSSKSKCPAVVRKVKGETDYKLYYVHSCATRSHGPADVTAIPALIQRHLIDTQTKLEPFVKMAF